MKTAIFRTTDRLVIVLMIHSNMYILRGIFVISLMGQFWIVNIGNYPLVIDLRVLCTFRNNLLLRLDKLGCAIHVLFYIQKPMCNFYVNFLCDIQSRPLSQSFCYILGRCSIVCSCDRARLKRYLKKLVHYMH